MRNLLLSCLLTFTGVILFGQTISLSREKQILVLHNIDSLVQNYEFYSTLSEGIKITESQKDKFLALFLDQNVKVFDDICPNYKNNNELIINEEVKTVKAYINDISNMYQSLSCGILETDAGSLYNRLQLKKDGLYVPVKITKEIVAYTKDSLVATYKTLSIQQLVIKIRDTTACLPVITEIIKAGICKWEYIPPVSKISRWEKIINVKSGIAMFDYESKDPVNFIEGFKHQPRLGYGIEGEFRYLFKNMETYSSGGSVGLGISVLNSRFTANHYTSAELLKDSDSDTYWQIMDLTQLREDQTIIGIDIPLMLSYEKWFNAGNGFYFKGGGVLSYYTGRYSTETNYSSSGYYPEFNLMHPLDPDLGFVDNQAYIMEKTDVLPLKPFNASISIELGWFFKLMDQYQLYTGINFYQPQMNFAPNTVAAPLLRPDPDDLSRKPIYNSINSDLQKLNLTVIGVRIGIKKLYKAVNYQKVINDIKFLN